MVVVDAAVAVVAVDVTMVVADALISVPMRAAVAVLRHALQNVK
jgi:aminoglycoside/choline kinase family phosphotransferase